jgi:hypothetical protein
MLAGRRASTDGRSLYAAPELWLRVTQNHAGRAALRRTPSSSVHKCGRRQPAVRARAPGRKTTRRALELPRGAKPPCADDVGGNSWRA